MADQPENPTYDAGVFQLETTTPVLGGVGGDSNAPLLNLANRTAYLKVHVDDLETGNTIPPTVAPLNSPVFTGDPQVPTAAAGDNDTSAASTAWAQRRYRGRLSRDIAGGSNVTLTVDEAGYGIIALTGTITANIAVIVPTATGRWIFENKTVGSFTVTIRTAAGTGPTVEQGRSREVYCDGTDVYAAERDYRDVALTGTPTAPTPTQGTNSTQVGNTAFLQQTVYGLITKDVAGGSTTVLSAAEAGNGILVFTGALTADKDVEVPATTKSWIVINNTTGSFGLTLTTAAGAGVILPGGQAVFAYCDATDVDLAGSANQNILTTTRIVATAGQTTFTVDYTPGALIVFKNGALLDETEYTADNGSQVILNVGAVVDDELVFYVFSSLEVANVEPQLPHTADTYVQRNAGNTAFEARTAAQVGADVGPHVQAGSTSAPGILELATLAEMNTGSDTGRVPAVNIVAAYVAAEIAELVDSAPGVLNTLNKIAGALNNDPDAFNTLNTAITARLVAASDLSDLASAATARTNLGLGDAATRNLGTSPLNVPDITTADNRYLIKANNLSGLTNVATARTNLGLGTAATRNVGVATSSEVPDRAAADARYAQTGQAASFGAVTATSYNATSDERRKENIKTAEVGLTRALHGVEFDWRDTGKRSAGVIAQAVQSVLPHLVDADEDGNLSVNYNGLVAYVLNDLNDYADRLEAAEQKNAELEARLEHLEAMLIP